MNDFQDISSRLTDAGFKHRVWRDGARPPALMILGDCREVMPMLPSVNLTVTSPPYDALRTYNDSSAWNWETFTAIAALLYRVTQPGGVVVWVVADATVNGSETGTSFRQALHFMDTGFRLHDTMFYQKDPQYPDPLRYQNCIEYMFVFSSGRPSAINLIRDKVNRKSGTSASGATDRNKDGSLREASGSKKGTRYRAMGIRGNVWKIGNGNNKTTKDKYAFAHPAMFPERLAADHIISWSNPSDLVFDPFSGAGTTGKMAVRHGRAFIGTEIDPSYYKIACNRINAAYSQTSLFQSPAKKPVPKTQDLFTETP